MRKVTLVINLEFPRKFFNNSSPSQNPEVDPETYLHRVGRTGRFGDHGIAVNFVVDKNQEQQLQDIMKHYKNEIKELKTTGIEEINDRLKEIDSYNVKKRTKLEEGDNLD